MIEEELEELEELSEDEPEQEQESYEHFRLEVDPGQNLLRIDRFLAKRVAHQDTRGGRSPMRTGKRQTREIKLPGKAERPRDLDVASPETGNPCYPGRYTAPHRLRGRLLAGYQQRAGHGGTSLVRALHGHSRERPRVALERQPSIQGKRSPTGTGTPDRQGYLRFACHREDGRSQNQIGVPILSQDIEQEICRRVLG